MWARLMAVAAATFAGAVLAPAGDGPAAADLVAARQAAYRLSAATFVSIKGAIDRGDTVEAQEAPARALAGWARALPAMFPPGSDAPPTQALPAVWSDRAGFEARAAAYAAAADRLAALAAAGDKLGFAAQWGEVRKRCAACHDGYRRSAGQRPG
jgi:cytochrome c556